MHLVRTRVASMVEADLGVRLRAPEQPASVRQAGSGPTVYTTGADDIDRERAEAGKPRVPTVQGAALAASGQERHAEHRQRQSRARAHRDAMKRPMCAAGDG
ncbi:hypothetical protein Vretifemale_3359, partial [Volvox reticuliferus]